MTNVNIGALGDFSVNIIGFTTCLGKIELDKNKIKPGEAVSIKTDIRNLESYTIADNTIMVSISKDGEVIRTFQDTPLIPSDSSKEFSVSHEFDKYASPGRYAIDAVLKDSEGKTIDAKSELFEIDENKVQPSKSESEKNYLFLTEFSVIFKNDGNVQSDAVIYNVSMPGHSSLFFRPVTSLYQKSSIEGNDVYSWQIPQLGPGETYMISYRMVYLTEWVIGIIAAAVLSFIYLSFYSVSIYKSHRHKGQIAKDKEISISLEIRNRGLHEVKDLVVRDRLPHAVRLVEKFETLKPTSKKLHDALELIWRVDSMKPREVRVLTYRVKSVVDILGTLKLPQASVTFEGIRGRKNTRTSNSPTVK